MSQEDLAKAANVDVKTVRDFELGKRWPWSKTRSAIARALGLSALDFQAAGEPETAVHEEIVPLDAFERAAMAADRPYAERVAAIMRHREILAEELERLGITEVPDFVRRAVRRRAGDGDDADARDARPA